MCVRLGSLASRDARARARSSPFRLLSCACALWLAQCGEKGVSAVDTMEHVFFESFYRRKGLSAWLVHALYSWQRV